MTKNLTEEEIAQIKAIKTSFETEQSVDDDLFNSLLDEYISIGSPSPNDISRRKNMAEFKKKLEQAFYFIKPMLKGKELKSSIAHMIHCLTNNIKTTTPCIFCGTHHAKFTHTHVRSDFCSSACSSKQAAKGRIGKPISQDTRDKRAAHWDSFGDKKHEVRREIIMKGRKTYKEKTGYDSWQNNPESVKAHNERMLEQYGVEWITQSDELKLKIKESIDSIPDFYEKREAVALETKTRNGTLPSSALARSRQSKNTPEQYAILDDKDKLHSLLKEHPFSKVSEILEVDEWTVRRMAKNHGIVISSRYPETTGQRQIRVFIQSHMDVEISINDRNALGNRKELDIYIPSLKFAIEFNGIYYHTTQFRSDKNYHLQKTIDCENAGITLIQVFEDEWNNRQEQVKQKILSLLGVDNREKLHARKCNVISVSPDDANTFLEENHIQGKSKAKFRYGLEHNGELVAVMTFNKGTATEATYLELNRYATSKRVIGGFSKLMTHFWKSHPEVENIVSFADRRYSSPDNMYANSGWNFVGAVKPSYTYYYEYVRVRREHFMKSKLENILESYDPELTEEENCYNHGIYRIYDCGLLKYQIVNPHFSAN